MKGNDFEVQSRKITRMYTYRINEFKNGVLISLPMAIKRLSDISVDF